MSDRTNVIAETGLDLANPKLVDESLAPAFAQRLSTAFPAFDGARKVAVSIMNAYKGLSSSPTVVGAASAAIAAVGAAAGFLEGRLDRDIEGNAKRWENARNRTIARWVKPGDWSTAVYANGLPVGSVDLYNNALGWDESDFLAQYNEGFVWMSHRSAKSDILLPTWASPPFTDGFGFMSAERGFSFPLWSPLTGFSVSKRLHREGQPSIEPIPSKYDEDYFGTLPALIPQDLAEAGLEGAPKVLKSLVTKMEAAFYNRAFVPPPDYTYLFSVGTYPYISWSTASDGRPNTRGALELNSSLAALAAGIHSLSPIHALVRSKEVEKCYRAWLRATRIRQLPPIPKKQPEAGVYLDADGLPWAPTPLDSFNCVTKLRPGEDAPPQFDWQKKEAERCAADPQLADQINSSCYPVGLGLSYNMAWRTAREVEESFRSFFRVRRAALYQMDLTTDAFRKAAANSADPILAAAAKGKPPPYTQWSQADPLGDGWRPSKPAPKRTTPKSEPRPDSGLVVAPKSRDYSALIAFSAMGAAGLATLGYAERARLTSFLRQFAARLRGRR